MTVGTKRKSQYDNGLQQYAACLKIFVKQNRAYQFLTGLNLQYDQVWFRFR